MALMPNTVPTPSPTTPMPAAAIVAASMRPFGGGPSGSLGFSGTTITFTSGSGFFCSSSCFFAPSRRKMMASALLRSASVTSGMVR
jgi:hypothetical protein